MVSVSMMDLEVVGWVKAGKARRGSCGAIGFNSTFGVITGGRDWTGGMIGVGGTSVGAVETSDQRGVAGRARCGRQAGSVGSITLPLGLTMIFGIERLKFRDWGHGLLSQSKMLLWSDETITVVQSSVSMPCSCSVQSIVELLLEESLSDD